MGHGKTIKIFLMNDTEDDFVQGTISGRICVGYKIPRDKIAMCKTISHLNQTGVYFLFGEEDDGSPAIYVGQAAQRKNGYGLSQRLAEHDNPKESFWTDAVAMTATDDSLNPMMIWYLENWFYERAKKVGRYKLKNGNTPNPGKVTLAEEAALQDYIGDALLIIKHLGYDAFVPAKKKQTPGVQTELFYYNNPSRDVAAKAEIIIHTGDKKKRQTVVKAGSKISINVSDHFGTAERVKAYRDAFIKSGKIVNRVLQEDIPFKSQSGAGEFLNGTSFDGNSNWKTVSGNVPLKNLLV